MSEIAAIDPKMLISFVDNSRNFNILSRVYTKAKFLGIQNGLRGIEVAELAPHLCLPNLLCFGQEVVDRYQQEKCSVSRFVVGGSLKNSLYLASTKVAQEKKYDLLWVSQFRPARFGSTMPVLKENSLMLLEFVQRYCEESGRTLCIACSCKERNFSYEYQFLLQQIRVPKVRLVPNDDNNFSSYRAMDMANVTVTINSTIGFEGISRGNKVLFCNFSEDEYFDVPSGYSEGPWALRDPSGDYEKFAATLKSLENMHQEQWRAASRKMSEYFVSPEHSSSTVRILNEEVYRVI
jgi:surface carbohydrate biosynthesis protein